MVRRLYLSTVEFVADPQKVKLALCAIVLTLAVLSAFLPGVTAMAGEGPGGFH